MDSPALLLGVSPALVYLPDSSAYTSFTDMPTVSGHGSPTLLALEHASPLPAAALTSPLAPDEQYDQWSRSTAAGTAAFHPYSRPLARAACMPCRSAKKSCDNTRPCARCARAGTMCEDRSAEDVADGKRRRIRQPRHAGDKATHADMQHTHAAAAAAACMPQPVAAVPANIPLSADAFASDPSSSGAFFSALTLAASVCHGERDHLLRLWELVSSPMAAALNLPALLGWSSMSAMHLLMLSELLTPEHWQCWLTAGLTLEQQESRTMCTSPLDTWSKRAKRPFRSESVTHRAHSEHEASPRNACPAFGIEKLTHRLRGCSW